MTMPAFLARVSCFFLLLACSVSVHGQASNDAVPSAVQPGRSPAKELVEAGSPEDFIVRRVGEIDIYASDVFRMLDLAVPEQAAEVVSNMVLTIMVEQEAMRELIDVAEGKLEAQVEEALAQQSASFALEGPSGLDLEGYLLEVHGMTPPAYREHVRRGVLSELLLARVSRLQQMRETRDTLQMILMEDEAVALEVRSLLDEGASFSVLAKKHSLHGSAENGGLMPAISLEVTAPLLEGRESLEEGEVLGPAPITLQGKDYYRFLRLVERKEGVEGSWDELRDLVEADLLENPVSPDEVAIFEARMIARYRVSRPEQSL
jgi:hypothetical protein